MKAFFVLCFAAVAIEAINAQVIRSPNLINPGCGCGANPIIAPISPCSNIIAPISPCSNIIAPISPCSNVIAPISPCTNSIYSPIYSDVISPIIPSYSNVIASPVSSGIVSSISPAGSSTIIAQQPSVAANLADTLSLLTVSSLLAETLPLSSNVIVAPPCGMYGGYNGYVF